jgi:hypothetical protein
MTEICKKKCRGEVLHEMKYSPCGKYLAVGSNENVVDVFEKDFGYKRLGNCSGELLFVKVLIRID